MLIHEAANNHFGETWSHEITVDLSVRLIYDIDRY